MLNLFGKKNNNKVVSNEKLELQNQNLKIKNQDFECLIKIINKVVQSGVSLVRDPFKYHLYEIVHNKNKDREIDEYVATFHTLNSDEKVEGTVYFYIFSNDKVLQMDFEIIGNKIILDNIINNKKQNQYKGYGSIAMRYLFTIVDMFKIEKIYGDRDYDSNDKGNPHALDPQDYLSHEERQREFYEKFGFTVTDNTIKWERAKNKHPFT